MDYQATKQRQMEMMLHESEENPLELVGLEANLSNMEKTQELCNEPQNISS